MPYKMRKTAIIIVLNLLIISSINAQKVPYEKLEEISTEISKLQLGSNNQTFKDGATDYEISFPNENFMVSIGTHLATNTVYKKNGDNEILELTEDIDLSKLLSAKFIHAAGEKLAIFRMQFPKASLNTKKYINGIQNGITKVDYLDLYVINTDKPWDLYNSMIHLFYLLKTEKKLPNKYNIDELDKNWRETVVTFSSKSFEEFIKKYPNTLYQPQALRMIDILEKQNLERGKMATSIIEYATEICNAYLWKPNMTENEFKSYNPTINKESWTTNYSEGNTHYSRKMGIHLTVGGYLSEGPQSYTVNKSGKVSAFGTTIKKEKNSSKEIRKLYDDAKIITKEKIGQNNFSEKKGSTESFTIAVPKSADDPYSFQYYTTTYLFEVDKWSFIQIYFHITNNP
jgi:hypothetical protein